MTVQVPSKDVSLRTWFEIDGRRVPIGEVESIALREPGIFPGAVEIRIGDTTVLDATPLDVGGFWRDAVQMLEYQEQDLSFGIGLDEPTEVLVEPIDNDTVNVARVAAWNISLRRAEARADRVAFVRAMAKAAWECLTKCMELDPVESAYMHEPIAIAREFYEAASSPSAEGGQP